MNVWFGLIGPFVLEQRLTADNYLNFLKNFNGGRAPEEKVQDLTSAGLSASTFWSSNCGFL
jgi:hypothetical protein